MHSSTTAPERERGRTSGTTGEFGHIPNPRYVPPSLFSSIILHRLTIANADNGASKPKWRVCYPTLCIFASLTLFSFRLAGSGHRSFTTSLVKVLYLPSL